MKLGMIVGVVSAGIATLMGTYNSLMPIVTSLKTDAISGYEAGVSFAIIGAIIGISCALLGVVINSAQCGGLCMPI